MMTPNTQYYFDHSDLFPPFQTAVGDQSFAVSLTRRRSGKGSQMVDPKRSQFVALLGVKYGQGNSKIVWKTRADWRKMCSFQLGHQREHAAIQELMAKLKQAEDIAERLNKRIVDQTSAENARKKAKDERVRQAQDEKNKKREVHDAAAKTAARMDRLETLLMGLVEKLNPADDVELEAPSPPTNDPMDAPRRDAPLPGADAGFWD
jgi:hypothetical protein